MAKDELVLSSLPKTWIFDLDGTVVKHNGYLKDGFDTMLEKSVKFIRCIPIEDKIIFITSRTEKYRNQTIDMLKNAGIRFDEIIFGMPVGERILVNDCKPSGLKMAYAVNLERDAGINIVTRVDNTL